MKQKNSYPSVNTPLTFLFVLTTLLKSLLNAPYIPGSLGTDISHMGTTKEVNNRNQNQIVCGKFGREISSLILLALCL